MFDDLQDLIIGFEFVRINPDALFHKEREILDQTFALDQKAIVELICSHLEILVENCIEFLLCNFSRVGTLDSIDCESWKIQRSE